MIHIIFTVIKPFSDFLSWMTMDFLMSPVHCIHKAFEVKQNAEYELWYGISARSQLSQMALADAAFLIGWRSNSVTAAADTLL